MASKQDVVGRLDNIILRWSELGDGTHAPDGTIVRAQRDVAELTITSGQTTSDTFDARGYAMFGLVMPNAFTGTSISFEVSADGQTWQALYDTSNTLVSVTVAAGRSYDLPSELAPWPYWRIVSGSAEGDDRTLYVVAKG